MRTIHFLFILAFSIFYYSCSDKSKIILNSPDGKYQFSFFGENELNYGVEWNNTVIVDTSAMGFLLKDGTTIPGEVTINKIEKSTLDESWNPVYGEQSSYRNNYNEAAIYCSSNALKGEFIIRVRLYNEGVAFRYETINNDELQIKDETTSFRFIQEPKVWVSNKAQGYISEMPLSKAKNLLERPLVAELSDSLFVAIGEAALVDFSRMKFKLHPEKKNTLQADLYKVRDKAIVGKASSFISPWRFVMAGKTPAQLLQNNFLLLNLNEENQIKDTAFIKPGKVLREVTLTTKGGIACVDFAAKHNIEFVEFDAGWYGNEYKDESDATTVTVDPNRSPGPLELRKIIDYANSKGVGIILYVNRRALEKQLDEVLPLLKEWGVAGVKYGFVRVGSQEWTTWLHDAVRKAAEHGLMVDIHDEYRPTGYSRTYPNLMTQEGIRGDEESPTNEMVIKTIFTRMIAGAGDHTNCYFAERVAIKMGSHASQMAKAICVYSPWQFIYWYDRPINSPGKKGGAGGAYSVIHEIEDIKFYDQLPTVWDETQILEGYPGKFAAIARKKGDKWVLGALAGTENYMMNINLSFLEDNRRYKATIYSDDASLNTSTNVKIQEMEVSSASTLKREILKQNGLAVIFTAIN